MAKEIGGYLEFEHYNTSEYYSDLIALNTARNALLYLLIAKKIKKLYLPYFLCDSVYTLCEQNGFEYEFYSINPDFTPVFSEELGKDEYLYVVNFYGQLTDEGILNLKKKHENIILDNVQAFFRKPIENIDAIYCCRKFFGVPDGAYLSTDAVLSEPLETDKSKDRLVHLFGRFEESASEYYKKFQENEHTFENLPLRYMSELTHNLLRAVDYEFVASARSSNFRTLDNLLKDVNTIQPRFNDGAYCYPLYLKNGLSIKRELAKNNIFIPTLWPNAAELKGTLECDYAENILPLPVDQRYNAEDMEYLAKEVLKCID
ncbi:MAG: hypothetical protein IKL10_09865 [Clostridia bacterium]|nr:hypothetical protein [Clostridia bacterium]